MTDKDLKPITEMTTPDLVELRDACISGAEKEFKGFWASMGFLNNTAIALKLVLANQYDTEIARRQQTKGPQP